jgi:sugar/nucleoside kinase (ribokinase family)
VVYAGATGLLVPDDVSDEVMKTAKHLHLGSIGPVTAMNGENAAILLKRAQAHGLTTSIDISLPWGQWEDIKEALHYCDFFMPNIDEIDMMVGLRDIEAIKTFFKPFGIQVLVIKQGENGVFLTDFSKDIELPTFLVGELVDTLGAGDAFCTGFITAYHNGLSLRDCAIYANTCSAICLKKYGASTWAIDMNEIAEKAGELGYPIGTE